MPLPPSAVLPGGSSRFLAGLGVLTCDVSPELVDEVIDVAGCREERVRLLPARAVVYLVLGMCLLSAADSLAPPGYRSVLRSLTHGLRELDEGLGVPTAGAFTRARQRLGSTVMELLFGQVAGPRAPAGMPGAYAFGRRLVAWDGTVLDAADSAANLAAFGSHRGGGPQIRLVTLVECGTRALIDAAAGGYARCSEHELARGLIAALLPGMLLLADRNFPGWQLWGLAAATGADLLWRARANQKFQVVRELPDGSYLSVLPTPAEGQRLGQARRRGRPSRFRIPDGHQVRVIEYLVTITTAGGGSRTELVRLITTLLDPAEAPAGQIAGLYRQRWENESSNGELKTRLAGAGFTLRSRTPDLAWQELFAFLITCQALCGLRAGAAAEAGIDPDRVSFTVTLRTARDHVISAPLTASPDRARRHAITDLLADLLPPRRNRRYQRVIRPRRAGYPYMKKQLKRPPAKVTYHINITRTSQAQPARAP